MKSSQEFTEGKALEFISYNKEKGQSPTLANLLM